MRNLPVSRFLSSFAALVIGMAGLGVSHASAAVQNRISANLSNESHVALPNSVNPRVAHATDLGPAPTDTRLVGMSVRFNMTAAQQAALTQLLADQQDPSSPRYHQWLTPAQFAAQFGMSSADIAKVTAWLSGQGFTVTGVANGGTFVTFDGTVAQAEAAFGTKIHNLSYRRETRFANVSNVSLPSALVDVVGSVTGLNNFRLRSHVHTNVVASPKFTSDISGNHYLAPGDVYTIYGMNQLLKNAVNGSGVTIAVTGQVDINQSDVLAFRTAAGLSTTNLPTTIHEGGDPGTAANCSTSAANCPIPNQGDLAESTIDVEWASAIAPGATILFVNGPDIMFDAMTQAIDQNLAPIVTTSYGDCEAGWGTTYLTSLNQLFQQAAAQGQTVVAAAGDDGGTDCDVSAPATQGLTVDFPSSSPYVVSMGGTSFNDTSSASEYWSTTNGSTGGSALGYIPETIWNDETTQQSFGGGGGGASGFFTKPAWQQGTGVPADAARDVPDLALNGDDNPTHDSFLYCVSGFCTSGFRNATSNLEAAGGTSFDSQLFGGMLALIEQKVGSRIGNANPTIYALANSTAYYTPGSTILTNSNVVFNDVTGGNNSMPCSAGTPNCMTGGSIGYAATSGYDLASGWGSVNLYNLANAWNLVKPLSSGSTGSTVSTTTVTASPTSVAAGSTVTFTATVTGSSGTPTGTVQILVNGAVVGSGTLGSSGSASYTYTTSCSNLAQLTAPKVGKTDSGAEYASNKGHRLLFGMGSSVSIACLMLFFVPRKYRLGALYVAILSIALVAGTTGCGAGGTVVPGATGSSGSTGSMSTGPTNGTLIVEAAYSGDSTYAGSISSGITASGFTNTNTSVTPIKVTVTVGSCQ